MNDLLEDKYYCADDEGPPTDVTIEMNKYGFVRFKNPNYSIYGDESEYILRKPTPKERREIVINTVIECNGRTFAIPKLARQLGVTDRTIQNILRQLQKEGLIEIIPRRNKNGQQKANAYKYIGPPCEKYGPGLTLKLLHSAEQSVGFREWAWKECFFKHDKSWHSIYPLCQMKFETRAERKQYLLDNNLPLIVPEDIKFLVLRYCYWRGDTESLHIEHTEFHSIDGTIKLPLEPLGRTETVKFFEYTLLVEFGGSKDNPIIKIINTDISEDPFIFTWFDENIIAGEKELNDELSEQFFILGDFTTR